METRRSFLLPQASLMARDRAIVINAFTDKMQALMFTPEQVAQLLVQAYKCSVGTVHRLSSILDSMVEWVYTLKQYEGVTPEKITEIILGEFPVETSAIVVDEAMQAEGRLFRFQREDVAKLFNADPGLVPIMVYSTEGPTLYPRKAITFPLPPPEKYHGSKAAKFIPNK